MTQTIVLSAAGADTGPFDLYSNIDGFTIPFENNISKIALQGGYTSNLVPDNTTIIRVQSDNVLCGNFIDLTITSFPTTSTTTTVLGTTTTTTTGIPETTVQILNGATTGEVQITGVAVSDGRTFTPSGGSFPITSVGNMTGTIDGVGVFDLTIGINVTTPIHRLSIIGSDGMNACDDIPTPGAYVFNNIVCNNVTPVFILVEDGAC